MKKRFFIILFMGFVNIIPSCNPCGDDGPRYFQINEAEMQFGEFNSTSGSRRFEATDEMDTLKYGNAYFQITPADVEFVYQEKINNPFLNPLYACSPADPRHAQNIVRISITSPETLYLKGVTVPPNELISKYFFIDTFSSIVNFIADRPYFKNRFEHLNFRLNTPPDRMVNQPFRFVIEMDDGKIFDMTIDNVKIAAD